MAETTVALVHRCGAIVKDEKRCPGCGRPIMHIPPSTRELAATVESMTGLDRSRVSLLGLVTSVYMAGWDDAMEALGESEEECDAPVA